MCVTQCSQPSSPFFSPLEAGALRCAVLWSDPSFLSGPSDAPMDPEHEWETRFTKLVREAETNIVKIFRKHLPSRRAVPGTAMEITSVKEPNNEVYRKSCLDSHLNMAADQSVNLDSRSGIWRLKMKAREWDERQNDINRLRNGSDADLTQADSGQEEARRLRAEVAELRQAGEERERRVCALETEKKGLLARLQQLENRVVALEECESCQSKGGSRAGRIHRWGEKEEGAGGGNKLTKQVQELKEKVDSLQDKVEAALSPKQANNSGGQYMLKNGADSDDNELGPILDDHYGPADSDRNKGAELPSASSLSKDIFEGELEDWDTTDELSLEELNLSYTDGDSSGSVVN